MARLADLSLLRRAIFGDAVALAVVAVLGFAAHGALDETWRELATTLVTLIARAVAAPVAGFLRCRFLGIGVSATFVLTGIAIKGLTLVVRRVAYAAINRDR